MLDIQIIRTAGDTREHLCIVVDGIEDHDSYCVQIEETIYAHLYDEAVYGRLIANSYGEVGKVLTSFTFPVPSDGRNLGYTVEVLLKNFDDLSQGILIKFDFAMEQWARPYSIARFAKIFKNIAEVEKKEEIRYNTEDEDSPINGFGIYMPASGEHTTISDDLTRAILAFRKLESNSEQFAIDSLDKDNLVTFFSFPENIKVACKQYLIYFAQFLFDMGIEAKTELSEQAGQILFKIIPTKLPQALDKIREALAIYLNAPAVNDIQLQLAPNSDLAITQWQANMMHLKSQIMFLNSALQMKDATIEALRLSNYQYHQLVLNDDRDVDSNSQEDVIKGILSLKKYEGKGFSINLPEIFRRLKRQFRNP